MRFTCAATLMLSLCALQAHTAAQSPQTPSEPTRPAAPGEAARSEPEILKKEAHDDAVPVLQRERITRAGSQNVRVPLEPAASASPLAPDGLVVVAGKALVAKERDGSVVLEQGKRSTSVLSTAGTRSISPLSLASSKDKIRLPWLVIDAQSQAAGDVVRSAQPFIKLARAIQWDPERKLHVAEFLIGLEAESGESGALAEPIDASIIVSCDEVEPHVVHFTAIGPSGDQYVRVHCSAHVKNERPEQELSLRLRGAEYTYPFEIPHRAGRFELQASTTTVLGMGLGELNLTVVQREEDGTALVADTPVVVPLHLSDGEIEPSSLTIAAGQAQGQISVHVRGPGELQIRAGLAERESEPVSIQVRWPALLSCMAPAGGAVGGFLAQRWQRRHPSKKRSRRRQHVMAIVEGAIVGTVLVLALMLVPSFGIVPDWARTAEVAWFVVAVFSGFLGLELLDRVARLFFRQGHNADNNPGAAPSSPARTTQP